MKSIVEYRHINIIKEHIDKSIPITYSFLRYGSESWLSLINYCRINEICIDESDRIILEKLDTGEKGYINKDGEKVEVDLDLPRIDRSGSNKKYYVYRKNPNGDEFNGKPMAVIIRWGDRILSIKNDDKDAVDSFWSRHKCSTKKDMYSPGWWACYAPEMFGDILKLSGGKSRW